MHLNYSELTSNLSFWGGQILLVARYIELRGRGQVENLLADGFGHEVLHLFAN